jgi:hypothetical protein
VLSKINRKSLYKLFVYALIFLKRYDDDGDDDDDDDSNKPTNAINEI